MAHFYGHGNNHLHGPDRRNVAISNGDPGYYPCTQTQNYRSSQTYQTNTNVYAIPLASLVPKHYQLNINGIVPTGYGNNLTISQQSSFIEICGGGRCRF